MSHPVESIYQACDQWQEPLGRILYDTVTGIRAKTVVEIGTNIGDSTRILTAALQHTLGHLWSIDLEGPKEDGIAGAWVQHLSGNNVTFLKGDSTRCEWSKPLDMVLIDGDHTQGGCTKDISRWWPFLRPKGWMLVHDVVLIPAVRDALHEWAKANRQEFLTYPIGVGLALAQKP